jgi:hypothetical protein
MKPDRSVDFLCAQDYREQYKIVVMVNPVIASIAALAAARCMNARLWRGA